MPCSRTSCSAMEVEGLQQVGVLVSNDVQHSQLHPGSRSWNQGLEFLGGAAKSQYYLWGHVESQNEVRGSADQVWPGSCSGNFLVLPIPMCEEEATLEDLAEDCPADPLRPVSEVPHSRDSFCHQRPLLQILQGQPVQVMIFAAQEPEELEVRLRSRTEYAAGGALEEVLAALRSISAQCNASFIRSVHGNSAQAAARAL